MVMTAYFDESGTHGAELPLVTVAGFVSTVDQWSNYEHDLSLLLNEFGIEIFHAKEFRQKKGPFKGWQETKRARFNSQFLQIADNNLAYGLAMIVDNKDYRDIYSPGTFRKKSRPDTIYGLCFRAALLKVLLLVKDSSDMWPINIILENGHKNAGDALRIFGEMKDQLNPKYSPYLGKISFGTKRDTVPLAISDSLAYAIFRMSAGYSKHPTNPNAVVVGPSNPPYYVHKIQLSRTQIDREGLAQMRAILLARAARV